jgi:hypothetical protein
MRQSDPPVSYLVGTPKGRLTRLERSFLTKPWAEARESVQVKLLEQAGELYVLARSEGRVDKERAMRRRRLTDLPPEISRKCWNSVENTVNLFNSVGM